MLLPIVVNNFDKQSDVIDVISGQVEDKSLVVHGRESILLDSRLLLLDALALANQADLHVGVCLGENCLFLV